MTNVEPQVSVWEALAGRAPGKPVNAVDADLWRTVVGRLDPAEVRPVLRAGIESVDLVSVRGSHYVMLRSPDLRSPDDGPRACYLRLTPDEWQLAQLMDGTRTLARLVAEFAQIAASVAPDQVRRVVADLAANQMLDELPVDTFAPPPDLPRQARSGRLAQVVLAAARGRRYVAADVDRFVSVLYRAGGRVLFTRTAVGLMAVVAVVGLGLFGLNWWRGSQPIFLAADSYLLGALLLVLLNVVALACHEFGHALAAKHAGRDVPTAGVLVYFGIPSVFVDTSDVWMAGRRARLVTTAAGPAAGLVLAGVIQLVGLAVPALGPLAFKLAFVWYVNALFNLNPFLALDGCYLLMDWLEIPDLRARGLAWAASRLRGRAPNWGSPDREGRLVALYGVLALLWLVIAVNVGYRIWIDHVTGLATGLWHDGWPARVLLLAIVIGLGAPLLRLAIGRCARWRRRSRQRADERRREADEPRRLAALRASELAGLPAPALTRLAARARWLHPAPGYPLLRAGASQPAVYVVVTGALHGRCPGDPGGTIRRRVGPGGVVGLGPALTGRPGTMDWHTAGTTLLALPTATVATVIGPLPGPRPSDRAEAEALLAETPALAGLDVEDRLAVIATAHPVDLRSGVPVILDGPTQAVIVASGVIALPDGVELRRGTMVGPVGEGVPGTVAQTRTRVRLWVLPDAARVPSLLAAAGAAANTSAPAPARPAPTTGVHTEIDYPPLAVPPGLPADIDPTVDGCFERQLRWLALVVLVLAPLLTGINLVPGPAWAEMPADRALLTVDRGAVTVVLGGTPVRLTPGERRYVDAGSRVAVAGRSTGRLTFRGGAAMLLCGGSRATVGRLASTGARTLAPYGELSVDVGRLLADTSSASGAFAPLALVVHRVAGDVASVGAARYAVDPVAVAVASGTVTVADVAQPAGGGTPTCGEDVPVAPAADTPAPAPRTRPRTSRTRPPVTESTARQPSTGAPSASISTSAPSAPRPSSRLTVTSAASDGSGPGLQRTARTPGVVWWRSWDEFGISVPGDPGAATP